MDVDVTVTPVCTVFFVIGWMRRHGSCRCVVRHHSGPCTTSLATSWTLAEAGNLTWTTTNGNYSEVNQQYFPDHVGVWWLNLTSVSGPLMN